MHQVQIAASLFLQPNKQSSTKSNSKSDTGAIFNGQNTTIETVQIPRKAIVLPQPNLQINPRPKWNTHELIHRALSIRHIIKHTNWISKRAASTRKQPARFESKLRESARRRTRKRTIHESFAAAGTAAPASPDEEEKHESKKKISRKEWARKEATGAEEEDEDAVPELEV